MTIRIRSLAELKKRASHIGMQSGDCPDAMNVANIVADLIVHLERGIEREAKTNERLSYLKQRLPRRPSGN
ncbi:MAG: hypothetical protein IT425_10555 [Pirellulales bacterium]|nr:hypothetical protein [Pirellulales bacterium]